MTEALSFSPARLGRLYRFIAGESISRTRVVSSVPVYLGNLNIRRATTMAEHEVKLDKEPSLIVHLLSTLVGVAGNCDRLIKEIMELGELAIVDKGKNDLQTEVDRSIQVFVKHFVDNLFPKVTLIAEEDINGETFCSNKEAWKWEPLKLNPEILALEDKLSEDFKDIKQDDIVVWVDPLDGTFEFTEGDLEHVTVMIGIAVKGQALGGVIHHPFFEVEGRLSKASRTIWGLKGVGYGGCEIKTPPDDKLIVAVTKSHSDPLLEAALKKLNPDGIIRVGGAGNKVLHIIDGLAHAYIVPSRGLKRWDSCACEAVLEAMGGLITDIRGNHYSYDKGVHPSNDHGLIAVLDKEKHKIFIELFRD